MCQLPRVVAEVLAQALEQRLLNESIYAEEACGWCDRVCAIA
jgi:hypothetical protein